MIVHPEHRHTQNRGLRSAERQRVFFYVLAYKNNSPMLLGYYRTQSEAERVGLMKAGGAFEVIPLETTSIDEASRILREQGILENGLNDSSFSRFKHT